MIITLLSGGLVGLALGLTGGGGSIFAVPLLLIAVGLPMREAVTVSLAVVGLTALYGAVMQRRVVQWRAGGVLGAGGILGAPLGAVLGDSLPESVGVVLFAVLMLLIGWRMWLGNLASDIPLAGISCRRSPDGSLQFHWSCAGKLAAAGALTGVLAGLFGVGGGFLVLPALLVVTGMPIERALATSLVAIFLIGASAFFSNLAAGGGFPVGVAVWFLAGGALGMTAGVALKSRLAGNRLTRIFAGMVVCVALWMLTTTFFA